MELVDSRPYRRDGTNSPLSRFSWLANKVSRPTELLPMPREIDPKALKVHNAQAAFDKPRDVVDDPELSHKEKKRALENLEQDAHQLMTASNEGMAPEREHVVRHEPKMDEVVKAQHRIGEKPKHKPAQ